MFSRIMPRLFAVPTTGGQSNPFLVGPDREADLRSRRPYFLLPLLGQKHRQLTDGAVLRVRSWVRAQGRPITDVFVLSHGWHRNFYSAVAAYDRLVACLRRLIGRGAIVPPAGFNPLFVTVHWHSDPGENLWVDKEGRRSKIGFIAGVRRAFRIAEPDKVNEGTFERDFELMFDLLSTLSAPDTDASGHEYDAVAQDLAHVLEERYELVGAPGSTLDDKVAALWTCYDEAPARRVLMGQDRKPQPFAAGLQGVQKLLGFVVAVVPVVTLLGVLLNLPVPKLTVRDVQFVVGAAAPIQSVRRATVRDAVGMGWRWVGGRTLDLARPMLGVAIAGTGEGALASRVRVHVAAMIALAVLSALLLGLIRLWRGLFANDRPATTIPWLALVPWLYLQVLFAVPVLIFSLVGLLLSFAYVGAVAQWLRLMSDEREGLRDRPTARMPTVSIAAAFAWIAHLPIRWLKSAVALESRFTNLADMIEAQLAFYDMQQRGVSTGAMLGDALADIWRDVPELKGARLHLAGHSFGALVVANAARRLAFRDDFHGDIRTVTFLQGALASGWLDRERTLQGKVSGAVSAIYSRYDTANGFWYPLGNLGREAAGHVGLCGDFDAVENPMPPMLVLPPLLGHRDRPYKVINIDASRLIYDGPAAVGGGHGDIYKDDVIHVLWAAMQV